MEPRGTRRWAIAEGCIPSSSHGPEPEMHSHETACILNAGDREAIVELTLFFADREPAGPYRVTVPPPHPAPALQRARQVPIGAILPRGHRRVTAFDVATRSMTSGRGAVGKC